MPRRFATDDGLSARVALVDCAVAFGDVRAGVTLVGRIRALSTVVCRCAASDAVSRSCDGPLTPFGLSSLLLAGSVFALACGQHGPQGSRNKGAGCRPRVTQATGQKRAKASQRSSAGCAGDFGLMEVAPAASAKQKPPESLTTVLLRERIARLEDAQSSESVGHGAVCLQALLRACDGTLHQWSRIRVQGRGTWR